jgi:cytochrome P450
MTDTERNAMLDARRQLLQALSDALEERRNVLSGDLVSDLAQAQAEGQPISDVEIIHNLFALVAAGHLTTTDMIGNGTWLLLKHPDQRDALLANPDLAASAVDEVLRCEPPISFTARFAHQEGALRGCPVHKGDTVAVSLMAVNRDPEVFSDPHAFDIARTPNPHLAFGAGAHICLGAPLARFVGQKAILALFQSFPNLRLADDAPPRWKPAPGTRGMERLDVLT